jgi:hypothetical protein
VKKSFIALTPGVTFPCRIPGTDSKLAEKNENDVESNDFGSKDIFLTRKMENVALKV